MAGSDKNQGLDAVTVDAYAVFDQCPKPCSTHPSGGKSFDQIAKAIDESSVDSSLCVHGLNGTVCPFSNPRVIEELEGLLSKPH